MAKIDFDYIRNKFGIILFKLKRKKILKVLIFCHQRTFSNYLESFLLKNFSFIRIGISANKGIMAR